MKKTENLQISCESEDLRLVDELRRQFDTFPPKRSEIARVLLRYAVNKVIQNPELLKVISKTFENAVIGDIAGIEWQSEYDFLMRVLDLDIQAERLIQIGMARTGRSREEIIADALRAGLEQREMECWAQMRRGQEQQRKRA